MKQTKTLTEVKMRMEMRGWTHSQEITINNEYDYNGHVIEGIAEITSHNPLVPFDIHYNEGFKYNVDKDELTIQKDDSLSGLWWFTPDFDVIDMKGEVIDSFDLDKQGFRPEFSNIDYSKMIEAAKGSQE
jgi:hypothetical protein